MTAQLCQLASDWLGDVPPAGLAVEEKVDGWRALYFRGLDGKPGLWTRNGLPIEGTGHILHTLNQLERVAGQPLFIDGEFQVGGTLEATKRWCESGWKLGGEAGLFHAFDAVPIVNWTQGRWDWPWHRRKAWLDSLLKRSQADLSLNWEWREGSRGRDEGREAVRVAQHSWAFDAIDVRDLVCPIWGAGREGLMLKDPQAPYQRNRNGAWQKLKTVAQFARAA